MTAAGVLVRSAGLPQHEARRLLALAAGCSIHDSYGSGSLPPAVEARFHRLVARRASGEPLQYIEREAAFGPLLIGCDRRALIPRPETEHLAELAAAAAVSDAVVVDIGTGSGCIALFVKHARPEARVIGTDIDPAALALARQNGASTGLRVEWLHGDLFTALPAAVKGRIDVVVSNPPYVAADEWERLPADVRMEPRTALVPGPSGMETLQRIAAEAPDWLRPGGLVAIEIHESRGAAAQALFPGFDVAVHSDLCERDRYLVGRRR